MREQAQREDTNNLFKVFGQWQIKQQIWDNIPNLLKGMRDPFLMSSPSFLLNTELRVAFRAMPSNPVPSFGRWSPGGGNVCIKLWQCFAAP